MATRHRLRFTVGSFAHNFKHDSKIHCPYVYRYGQAWDCNSGQGWSSPHKDPAPPIGTRNFCIIPRHVDSKSYAPSVTEKRQEREAFYNTEVVQLIPSSSTAMTLAGDFNCAITSDDCTGQRNYSRALARLNTGTGRHRRMGGDCDTNCTHTLHCYWRFQD